MLSEDEIREVSMDVVQEAKREARVDQGTLKRSIAYTYVKGIVTFRQRYYGVYGDNSKLEEIARKQMPIGVPYVIELTDEGNNKVEVSRSKTGRRSQKSVKAKVSNRQSSSNVNKLLQTIKRKKDGNKEKE